MNSTNKFLSDYIYLAEASYADFSGLSYSDIASVRERIENTGDKENSKPEAFATLVTDNYQVKAHYTDREGNGESSFSGTLFQNKETGAYVKAISKSNTNRQARPFR